MHCQYVQQHLKYLTPELFGQIIADPSITGGVASTGYVLCVRFVATERGAEALNCTSTTTSRPSSPNTNPAHYVFAMTHLALATSHVTMSCLSRVHILSLHCG